jgi:hypothetical protein
MTYYHIRRDQNEKCDDEKCGGETAIERHRDIIGWESIDPVSFAPFTDLGFLDNFRRRCKKCGRVFKMKYTILEE